jgi:predicted nucleotidyltransferase
MRPHHAATIERVVKRFSSDAGVSAILLVGSIAHGFEGERSDVDIALVVADEERERRAAEGQLTLTLFDPDLVTYEHGYVDCKFLSPSFLDAVERCGSEPARYAFAHARVLMSRAAGLPEQLERIARYPLAEKESRMQRFHAQLQAWQWYSGQAALRGNDYLASLAASKLSLFGGRLVLAHNELLYPYHKWFMTVLDQAPHKPAGLLDKMRALCREPSARNANELYELVNGYRAWPTGGVGWGEHFIRDTELTWLDGHAAIDEI